MSAEAALRSMITRGRIVAATLNPKRVLLQLSGLVAETKDKIELILPYGMSAKPKAGDVLLLQVCGSRAHIVALGADDPSLRITDLADGEFGFRDQNGQQVVFRSDRIEITTSKKLVATVGGDFDVTVTGKVVGSASEWDLTGNVKVTGNINATGNVTDSVRSMAADRTLFNSHTHGGVQSGGSNTAGPAPTQ